MNVTPNSTTKEEYKNNKSVALDAIVKRKSNVLICLHSMSILLHVTLFQVADYDEREMKKEV